MNYKEIIESRYNRQNWQLLLRDIFGSKIKFWSTPSIVATSSAFAKQALWLGTITLSDEQTIAVYEVELADSVDIERNRRGIRDMLLTTWRNNGNAGAFMFCYRKSESVLRFSYVSEAWKFVEDGSYQKETTDARRFTYLLGEGHRSRTAIQQFERLRDSGLSLKDLTKAFSVDAVSDMFFDGYKKQYEDIIFYITGKRMVKVANKWEERLEGQPCQHIMQQFSRFPNPEKAIRDYVKKLMGRLVFLQFLQKKGWLGVSIHDEWGSGDSEFIQNLFARCDDKDHFIDKVLEPLFNDLNSENEKKLPQYRTPYLNGGLFEQEAADGTDFPLPEKYMKSLLDFFASYNFTIDENDPDDAEVGVDPEMLGRIFENLLEDNKDKGAFYTPKEIVGYMCRESLIAYLQTGIDDETTKEAIRQFVTTHEVQEYLPENTDQLLKDVKICDPAIGSGAFPMGLLKELFLCRTALEGISQHQAAEIKKHIIQQNVYGVDIERGAVDIARLRFWLSLIVDEETPQALPNLDFKIMQGNSLLEQYKGVDLSTMTEKKADDTGMLTFFDDMIDVYRKELRDMLVQYFDCTDHKEKQSLRIRIIDNVKQQLLEQHIKVDFGDLDLSGNDQFFLWHTWFHDVFSKGGFDIVIGNPPYGASLSFAIKDIYKEMYKDVHMRTPDTYNYFISQGVRLCNKKGVLSYIIPNTLLSQNEYEKARIFLTETHKLVKVINIGDNVFEDADVPTCLIFVEISSSIEYSLEYADYKEIDNSKIIWGEGLVTIPITILKDVPGHVIGVSLGNGNLMNKISLASIRIDDIAYEMAAGISTGCNRAFCLDQIQIIENSIEPEILRPLIIGRDIDKYSIEWKNKYIIYTTKQTNIRDYPNAQKYVLPYKDKLDKRRETKKGMIPWWALNWPRYEELFIGEKIIMRQTSDSIQATYDTENYYPLNSILTLRLNENCGYSYKFVLGILNCKLTNWVYQNISQEKGRAFAEVKPINVRKLYIPQICHKDQIVYENIVERILKVKRKDPLADISPLESEIDRLVYQLYGLTYDEVLIVDPETPITREEYKG